MIYEGKHIIFCWLPFGQGMAINSKLCLVKLVKHPIKKWVHLDTTSDVIQHELNHCTTIKEKGWLDFMWTSVWHYFLNIFEPSERRNEVAYEPSAERAELSSNQELNTLLIEYCKQNNLTYY